MVLSLSSDRSSVARAMTIEIRNFASRPYRQTDGTGPGHACSPGELSREPAEPRLCIVDRMDRYLLDSRPRTQHD